MNACEFHPQRQQIIDAILSGESLRSIASRAVPRVGHSTIARFKLQVLQSAVEGLRTKALKPSPLKDFAAEPERVADPESRTAYVQDQVRRAVHERVQARLDRRERWIGQAEHAPVLHPMTGEKLAEKLDHKALASHDSNEGKDLDLLMRLHGLSQDVSGSVSVHVAVASELTSETGSTATAVQVITRR